MSGSGQTEIERWILTTLSPTPSTSAELLYERMPSQSAYQLAVIYEPLDPTRWAHWSDTAICRAFARAVHGAGRVLDVGPGDGWPSLRIAAGFDEVVGIDPSPRRVRVQRRNAERLGVENASFLEMDVLDLSFDAGSFGGVVAASSIEQSADPARALAEVYRVLKPGGSLAMIYENYAAYFDGGEGDEELWSETIGRQVFVYYQVRRRAPPRETWYRMRLDRDALRRVPGLAKIVAGLTGGAAEPGDLASADGEPGRPDELGLAFVRQLRAVVRSCKAFTLHHLTHARLDALLEDVGFVDVRHLDRRMPALRALYGAARDTGRLAELAPSFEALCDLHAHMAVDGARPGTEDFALARKPASR